MRSPCSAFFTRSSHIRASRWGFLFSTFSYCSPNPAISWHHSCIFTIMELSFYSLFNGTCLFISSLTLLAQTNFGATLVGGEH
jgi:glutamine amidotransferase-like uncharacterized protein